jgi:hypothetical protein
LPPYPVAVLAETEFMVAFDGIEDVSMVQLALLWNRPDESSPLSDTYDPAVQAFAHPPVPA